MQNPIASLLPSSRAASVGRVRHRVSLRRCTTTALSICRHPIAWRSFIVGFVITTIVLVHPGQAAAQDTVVSHEYAIKVGVIGVLGKCVNWPAEAAPAKGTPLIIGVLGKDPFIENGVNQLDRFVVEEKHKGRNIVVKRFNSAKDYEPCQILFVSSLAAADSAEQTVDERIAAADKVVDGETVLVVGESAGLSQRGAAANLIFDRATNLIRLELNPDAAARAGLKLAPDLLRLKLVQIVRDSKG